MIRIKRVYDPPAPEDGARVLVDRLWPRGLRREAAALAAWARELAPSDALRRWFGHRPERWPEFRRRYLAELRARRPALEALAARARAGPLTLVYAAADATRNNAVVLREALEALLAGRRRAASGRARAGASGRARAGRRRVSSSAASRARARRRRRARGSG